MSEIDDSLMTFASRLHALLNEWGPQTAAAAFRERGGSFNDQQRAIIWQKVFGTANIGELPHHHIHMTDGFIQSTMVTGGSVGSIIGNLFISGTDSEQIARERLETYLRNLTNKMQMGNFGVLDRSLKHGLRLEHLYVDLAVEGMISLDIDRLAVFENGDPTRPLPRADPRWALPDAAIHIEPVSDTYQPGVDDGADTSSKYAIMRHPTQEPPLRYLQARLAGAVAAHHPYLVLRGAPGCGKTTFLRYLTWALAHHALTPSVPLNLTGWPVEEEVLPILLPLRHLARQVFQSGTNALAVSQAICVELQNYGLQITLDDLSQWQRKLVQWQKKAILLLLDGLDEVPLDNSEAIANRENTIQAILAFHELYPNTRIIITSRTNVPLDLDWPEERLANFTFGQIRHLINLWCYHRITFQATHRFEAEMRRDQLLQALEQSPKLCAMAERPMLLAMMIMVFEQRGALPRDRSQLYEDLLTLMLGKWDEEDKNLSNLAKIVGVPESTMSKIRCLIDKFAHEIYCKVVTNGANNPGEFDEDQLLTRLIKFFRDEGIPDFPRAAYQCQQYLQSRSGLFASTNQQDMITFAHATLLEHCAGRYFARCMQDEDEAIDKLLRHREHHWNEPFLIAARLLPPSAIPKLIKYLVDEYEHDSDGISEIRPEKSYELHERDLTLATHVLIELNLDQFPERTQKILARNLHDDRQTLIDRLIFPASDSGSLLSTEERIQRRVLLGKLGDLRIPVTLERWQQEIQRIREYDDSGYFCRIDPDSYVIGSTEHSIETPPHYVSIHPPQVCNSILYIARYPVTRSQWQHWLASQHSLSAGNAWVNDYPNQPMTAISWEQSCQFCEWLSEQLGILVRLPTEYEWEAAARGSEERRYPWGMEFLDNHAATMENRQQIGLDGPPPVGSFPLGAAPNGTLDMAGTVWEWTSSIWQSYPDHPTPFRSNANRVIRGGSWEDSAQHVRCSTRRSAHLQEAPANVGLRIVVEVPV